MSNFTSLVYHLEDVKASRKTVQFYCLSINGQQLSYQKLSSHVINIELVNVSTCSNTNKVICWVRIDYIFLLLQSPLLHLYSTRSDQTCV